MRILLFGSNGQVGWELQRALAPLGDLTSLARAQADLGEPAGLPDLVACHRPDVIVNAAAYTAVDRAESEPELAARVNATAVGLLAQAAARQGALLVHYSTDYVFAGVGERPLPETAPVAPLGVYGRTKAAGESAVAAAGTRHLTFRTSWVYAARGRNFLRTILRLAGERDGLRIVADQVGAPTGAELIADVTAMAILRHREGGIADGIYHLAAGGSTSWFDYARHIVARAAALGAPLRCAPDAIEPTTTAEYGAPAPRPLNSRLDTGKLAAALGLCLPPWQAGVDRALAELLERA
jgi:dTDP-4-dehydrorhamnose reductase